MADILNILKNYWGYSAFRPLQQDIIESVVRGENVLALLPTGGGKSICFQVPGLALDGITIVVSPLIALMKDQVDQLKKRNIKAEAIYSGMNKFEIDSLLDNCIYGDIKFLYVSPERLRTKLFIERAKQMNICLLAIDESHCVSQWGYDFRPPYLQIPEFRNLIKPVPVIALTATTTKIVEKDILDKLNINNAKIFQKSFHRENLSYSVRKVENKESKIVNIINSIPGSAVVYVGTRKATKNLAGLLIRNNISADYYHAGLSPDERSTKQVNWIANKIRVIVSTNAFGMGIDKPDVRLVIHYDIAPSPEAYYQEAGRGGRDGKKAYAVILFNERDIRELQENSRIANPDFKYLKRVYQALANYLKVALGSGLGENYDFNISEFTSQFNLKPREAYIALKKLENEGLITLNEALLTPSKLRIRLGQEELYKFQVANKNHDSLIKTILRLYGGEIFTDFTKISESKIASVLKVNPLNIKAQLDILNKQDVIHYDMVKDIPQITFVEQRYDASALPISAKILAERNKNEFLKAKAMEDYVRNTVRCRSQILLEYFGEISYEECGICDTCLDAKRKSEKLHTKYYHNQILNTLRDKQLAMDELLDEILPENEDEFMHQIRMMIDSGEIKYNEHWELVINNE